MSLRRCVLAPTVLGATLASCAAAAPPDEADEALYVDATHLWRVMRPVVVDGATVTHAWAREVPVCVLNPSADTHGDLALVEGAVKQWTDAAGIRVAWAPGSCPPGQARGVRIEIRDTPISSAIGTWAEYAPRYPAGTATVVLNFTFSTWSAVCRGKSAMPNAESRKCVADGALHEFGHVFGSAHEQDRPDNHGQCERGVGALVAGREMRGGYDRDSVMNYCSPAKTTYDPTHTPLTLSSGDERGIGRTYGPRLLGAEISRVPGFMGSRDQVRLRWRPVADTARYDVVVYARSGARFTQVARGLVAPTACDAAACAVTLGGAEIPAVAPADVPAADLFFTARVQWSDDVDSGASTFAVPMSFAERR